MRAANRRRGWCVGDGAWVWSVERGVVGCAGRNETIKKALAVEGLKKCGRCDALGGYCMIKRFKTDPTRRV